MDEAKILKKTNLAYVIELAVIALIFAVIAILRLTGVWSGTNNVRRAIFHWITIFGGAWTITDFIWALASKRRRKKVCLLDKILNLPLGIYVMTFDIICFATWPEERFFIVGISIGFIYVAINYTFQAIYHYFKPVPQIIAAAEEVIQKIREEEAKEKALQEQSSLEEPESKEENNR